MRFLFVIFALLSLAPSLAAQQPNPFGFSPGDRIRLRAPLPGDLPVPARIVSVGPVYFGFAVEGREDIVYTRAFTSVDTVDVYLSSPRYSARTGALWGAYLGAALGAIGGPFAAAPMSIGTGSAMGLFGAGGAAIGTLTGAALGALVAPARWYRYVASP